MRTRMFVLFVVAHAASSQTGSIYLNPGYSDSNAPANITGTYTDGQQGSFAVVTDAASTIIHARVSWPSPGINDYETVSVINPDGTTQGLANYYGWQSWQSTDIVISDYPFQPGRTTFMVGGVSSGVTPAPTPSPGPITLAPGPATISPGTYSLPTPGFYGLTVETPSPTPTPTPSPSPNPTPTPGDIAPAVPLPSGYVLAFDEEFSEGASFVTDWVTNSANVAPYPGSPRWFDEKPDQTYFFDSLGNSGIDAPPNVFTADAAGAGFPLGPAVSGPVGNGYLYLYGFHSDYRSSPNSIGDFGGLLCSVDPAGHGFSAALGYWETKIWLPPITTGSPPNAQGLWPAFWLLDKGNIFPQAYTEIDIMEGYSVDYTKYHTNLHGFHQSNPSPGATIQAPSDLSLGWHVYSCLIDPVNVTFWLDGVQVSQFPSVPNDQLPLYCLIDFAFGGGWPDQQNWGTDPGNNAPWSNTTNMKVAYIRCWAMPGNF